jgi:hypothetical protein
MGLIFLAPGKPLLPPGKLPLKLPPGRFPLKFPPGTGTLPEGLLGTFPEGLLGTLPCGLLGTFPEALLLAEPELFPGVTAGALPELEPPPTDVPPAAPPVGAAHNERLQRNVVSVISFFIILFGYWFAEFLKAWAMPALKSPISMLKINSPPLADISSSADCEADLEFRKLFSFDLSLESRWQLL